MRFLFYVKKLFQEISFNESNAMNRLAESIQRMPVSTETKIQSIFLGERDEVH